MASNFMTERTHPNSPSAISTEVRYYVLSPGTIPQTPNLFLVSMQSTFLTCHVNAFPSKANLETFSEENDDVRELVDSVARKTSNLVINHVTILNFAFSGKN